MSNSSHVGWLNTVIQNKIPYLLMIIIMHTHYTHYYNAERVELSEVEYSRVYIPMK
jgi:hypothetical protein